MPATSVQFAVATHIMAALAFHDGSPVNSAALAQSVKAEPTFVRKSISKLVRAGLVTTTRGKNGACVLARSPRQITLRDIYLASEASGPFAIHSYPVERACPISSNFKACLSGIQAETQRTIEAALSKITLQSLVAKLRKKAKAK